MSRVRQAIDLWPVWLIIVTPLMACLTLFNLSQDLNKPFAGFFTFYEIWTNRWVIDPATPPWWSAIGQVGLAYDDYLLALDEQPYGANPGLILARVSQRQEPSISLVVARNNQQTYLELPITLFTLSDLLDIKLPELLNGFAFWLLAIIVYIAQPKSPLNRVFVGLCCTQALNDFDNIKSLSPLYDSLSNFLDFSWVIFVAPLRSAFLFHFGLLFPQKLHFRLTYSLYILYAITFANGLLYGFNRVLFFRQGWSLTVKYLELWGFYSCWVIGLAGFGILVARSVNIWWHTGERSLEKLQVKFFLFGCTLSAVYYLPLTIRFFLQQPAVVFMGDLDLRYFSLAIPAFFAMVITRYQTFQNSRNFSLAIPIIGLSSFIASVGAAIWRGAVGTNGLSPFALIFVMVAVSSFIWSNQVRLQGFFGKLFHWQERNYEAVNRFWQKLVTQTNMARLPAEIAQALISELELAQAALWLWRENRQVFELVAPAGTWPHPLPLHLTPEPEALALFTRPVRLDTPSPPNWLMALPQPAKLAIPLLASNQILGLMVLGKRWDEEIFNQRDLTIIELISQQAALFLLTANQIDEIRQIPQLLDETQEQERTKIAQELHDTVQQFLGRLPFFLEISRPVNQNDPKQADAILRQCMNDVEEAARVLRQIRHDLTIEQVENGLSQPLKDLVERMERQSEIAVQLDLPSHLDQSLNKRACYALYRVIGQAIDNAIEHAQPTLIQVKLDDCDGKITFHVIDDGRGSSEADRLKAQNQGSFGLKSMTARIQNLGGEFSFSSAPNKGTVVSGWLPKQQIN